jgi:hypothetical protein
MFDVIIFFIDPPPPYRKTFQTPLSPSGQSGTLRVFNIDKYETSVNVIDLSISARGSVLLMPPFLICVWEGVKIDN